MINNDRTLVQMKFIILNLRTSAFLHRWNNCLHNRWAYWYQSVGKCKFNQMRNCFENTPISNTYLCSTVGQCKIINNTLLINYRWFSKLYFLINVVSLVSKLPEYFYADFLKKVKFIRVKFLSLLIEQAPTLLQRVEEDFKSITG